MLIVAEFPNLPMTGTLLLWAPPSFFNMAIDIFLGSSYYSPSLNIGDSSFKLIFLTTGFLIPPFFGVIMLLVCCLWLRLENSCVCISMLPGFYPLDICVLWSLRSIGFYWQLLVMNPEMLAEVLFFIADPLFDKLFINFWLLCGLLPPPIRETLEYWCSLFWNKNRYLFW